MMLANGISLETKYADNSLKIASAVALTPKKSEKKIFVAQRIGGGANKTRIHHQQGFVPMSLCFIELEGEVGLLWHPNKLTLNIVGHYFDAPAYRFIRQAQL